MKAIMEKMQIHFLHDGFIKTTVAHYLELNSHNITKLATQLATTLNFHPDVKVNSSTCAGYHLPIEKYHRVFSFFKWGSSPVDK